jgi:hypothetical protein
MLGDGSKNAGTRAPSRLRLRISFRATPSLASHAPTRSSAGEISLPVATAKVAANFPRCSASRQFSGNKICHGTAAGTGTGLVADGAAGVGTALAGFSAANPVATAWQQTAQLR